jgi:hypothetical protein
MMEAICFSEKSVLTRATRRHIPEDGILDDVMVRIYEELQGTEVVEDCGEVYLLEYVSRSWVQMFADVSDGHTASISNVEL